VAPSLALAAGWRVPTPATTYTLVGGLIVSRFGLWTFDLAVAQMLQERVPDGELGAER
jgi:iron-regulated transporter 1